ncbi:MAG: hypothetical protein ACR2JW_11700 [Thermomicrobiales bacterium]
MSDDLFKKDVTRREAMKTALKAGAYTAPVILTAAVPAVVGASPPPLACSTMTTSGGAGVTTNVHELGRTSGTFVFSWDAFTIPDKFDVFYQGALLFSTGFVSFTGTHTITYTGASTRVTVVVTGSSAATAWTYTVNCPTPLV